MNASATKFDIYTNDGQFLATRGETEIEEVAQLDLNDINWAIEEHGVCSYADLESGELLHIVEHGDLLPEDISSVASEGSCREWAQG